MVRRLGFRPLVLVFGLSVAFCGARRLLALIYYAPRKIGIWRGKEGSTVQRFDGSTVQRFDGSTYRLSTNCTGLWVASRSFDVQNHCRPSYFSLREK